MAGRMTGGAHGWSTIGFLFLAGCLLLPAAVPAKDTYRFERMWPTLQQQWYFACPWSVAADKDGNVYVVTAYDGAVNKLTPDGRLIHKWGRFGAGPGEFSDPGGIALDRQGHVYVADSGSHRIQKFTSDGRFVRQWGKEGAGDGDFEYPDSIAVDPEGNVYVADIGNDRIQKFTSEGVFLCKWGTHGTRPGEFVLWCFLDTEEHFKWDAGIAVDASGSVYVSDIGNDRIQKFDGNGQFIKMWGKSGAQDGELNRPSGIEIDGNGCIYVVDTLNYRIQKFNPEGEFRGKWGTPYSHDNQQGITWVSSMALDDKGSVYLSEPWFFSVNKFTTEGRALGRWCASGSEDGHFDGPPGLAVDSSGNIYAADQANNRIQKFSPEGKLIAKWGEYGEGNGQFYAPISVAIDSSDNVFVLEHWNCRIQKFTAGGEFITKWGREGQGDGELCYPDGMSVDALGNVYVADLGNYRVQKFSGDGRLLTKWGSKGSGDGQFDWLDSSLITVDRAGSVYVADWYNRRVQKFDSNGKLLAKWGINASGDAGLSYPVAVATDETGNICVIDASSMYVPWTISVKTFTPEGELLSKWGETGINPGQMMMPFSMAINKEGSFHVSDWTLSNIQVFKKVSMASRNKAIIVAGGGPYAGNHLWEATEMNANFAYRALNYQGFTKNRIFYLSSNPRLDLDGNGLYDDVDARASCANLEKALTQWAKGADDVLVYLVDHGGEGSFRLTGEETLSADDLASWLEELQSNITGKLIIVYDACESGSFLSALSTSPGTDRIVITSTSVKESAYFINHGSISFSSYFWTNVFNGLGVFDAFTLAREAMGYAGDYQHPLLDDNGNGKGNDPADGALAQKTFIGNGTSTYDEAPAIGSVSPHQTIKGKSSAGLYAKGVKDKDGIARVWAVIRPPDFEPPSRGNPVKELPSIDFIPGTKGAYSGVYKEFNTTGAYQVAIYAMDRIGNISAPKLTAVSVNSPLRRRAILVAGGSQSDALWEATEKGVRFAHEALTAQGYKEEDILFLSPVTIPGVDQAPSLENLRYGLDTWAARDTKDLVVYLIGSGDVQSFRLSEKETLSASDLSSWLDKLQTVMHGCVALIYDGCRSGSFLPFLKPSMGSPRICIASTGEDQPAAFLSGGEISFSHFFWSQVASGANTREAFLQAKTSIRYTCPRQIASLDDDGDGVGNERTDGALAAKLTIGAGAVAAADPPIIGSVCPARTLTGEKSAGIWVKRVTATQKIRKVWAIISPPGAQSGPPSDPVTGLPTVQLEEEAKGEYVATYKGFDHLGTYRISIYAMDENGGISLPKQTRVIQMK